MSRSLAIKDALGVALLTLCLVTANAAYSQAVSPLESKSRPLRQRMLRAVSPMQQPSPTRE